MSTRPTLIPTPSPPQPIITQIPLRSTQCEINLTTDGSAQDVRHLSNRIDRNSVPGTPRLRQSVAMRSEHCRPRSPVAKTDTERTFRKQMAEV